MNELQTTTQQVLWGFFLGAFALGWISQRTHFCTMGAVADVVNGRPVRNTEALANPDALEQYRDRPELQS